MARKNKLKIYLIFLVRKSTSRAVLLGTIRLPIPSTFSFSFPQVSQQPNRRPHTNKIKSATSTQSLPSSKHTPNFNLHLQTKRLRLPTKQHASPKSTYLQETIWFSDNRTVEQTGGLNHREIQHIVSDRHARPSLRRRSRPENTVRKVLDGEVRVRVNFDERLESHGCCKTTSSRCPEKAERWSSAISDALRGMWSD